MLKRYGARTKEISGVSSLPLLFLPYTSLGFALYLFSICCIRLEASPSSMWDDFRADWEAIATVPLRLNENVLWYGLPTAGAGLGLMTQDVFIARQMRQDHTAPLDGLGQVGNALGDGVFGLSAMALMMAFGGEFDRKVGVTGVLAFVEAGILTQVAKNLTGRLRPSDSPEEAGRWTGPRIGNFAFPSGHVTTATLFSVLMANAYGWGWVCYAVPPLVAWARMYSDVHWASDVFGGFLLGWGVASLQETRVQSNSPVRFNWRRADQWEVAWVVGW